MTRLEFMKELFNKKWLRLRYPFEIVCSSNCSLKCELRKYCDEAFPLDMQSSKLEIKELLEKYPEIGVVL